MWSWHTPAPPRTLRWPWCPPKSPPGCRACASAKALHQPDQCRPVALLATLLGGERDQRVIGVGQAGCCAQERQGRLAPAPPVAVRVDLHLAAGSQRQVAMGFVQGQHMQDVAIGVDLALDLAGQVQLPFIDALALAAARRQAQETGCCCCTSLA